MKLYAKIDPLFRYRVLVRKGHDKYQSVYSFLSLRLFLGNVCHKVIISDKPLPGYTTLNYYEDNIREFPIYAITRCEFTNYKEIHICREALLSAGMKLEGVIYAKKG